MCLSCTRKYLGKKIQQIRNEKNISLSELAEKTLINKSYLAKIEQGTAKRVHLEHAGAIAAAFGIDVIELFKFKN